ncbi:hypothetical protein O181_067365 [Austropuccinia psidii MF-1]|uniref:Uncharacterized protein n=1 Tax=Austropuccinia psidii MF-1 TaxID=1389203 RepID=A0A9Q3I605_9BASI|nr:hypothetical protein [Austropuccinia psidii MF-1]
MGLLTTPSSIRLIAGRSSRHKAERAAPSAQESPIKSPLKSSTSKSSSLPGPKSIRSRSFRTPLPFTTPATPRPAVADVIDHPSPTKTPRTLSHKSDVKCRLPRAKRSSITPQASTSFATAAIPLESQPAKSQSKRISTNRLKPLTTSGSNNANPSIKPINQENSKESSNHAANQPNIPKDLPSQIPKTKRPSILCSQDQTHPKASEQSSEITESQRAAQTINIVFSPIAEEKSITAGPLTRSKSKNLLNLSTGSQDPLVQTSLPYIKRKPSRVLQLARSFEVTDSDEADLSGTSRHSSLAVPSPTSTIKGSPEFAKFNHIGMTPTRKPSVPASIGSASSLVSPPISGASNSPNLAALAASLSKQHSHRGRLSNSRSITDVLKSSTNSLLGKLRWEDGVSDVLLTDPNETEAMVADISLSETTPIKPPTHSTSARVNFLSVVQECERAEEGEGETKGINRPNSRRLSQFESPLVRVGAQNGSTRGLSLQDKLIAQEAQIASLILSLENSRQQELKLQSQLEKLETEQKPNDKINGTEKPTQEEREGLLVEEIKRLEKELEEFGEVNIKLENELDLVKFEKDEIQSKANSMKKEIERLNLKIDKQSLQINKLNNNNVNLIKLNHSDHEDENFNSNFGSQQSQINNLIKRNLKNQRKFKSEVNNELETIKNQLNILHILKISLNLEQNLILS